MLNSTTNIILTLMENGESFDAAVKYCQQIGIAETDHSADVDGWDAAIKVAALGDLSIVETDPGPHTTAYGLLADFVNAVRG